MKTILVPTDFSKIAANAINYAVEIAKLTKAKLILFNVYNVPVMASEPIVVVSPLEEFEKASVAELKKIQSEIFLKHGTELKVDYKSKYGFVVDEINLFAKENKVDLIVMGMHGGGYLTEKLIGSITTSLLRQAKCPVLAIEKNVKFKAIKKIVLACDYSDIENKSVLGPLKEIVSLFKSHVYVLNVIDEFALVPSIPDAVSNFISLEKSLTDVEHSLHYLKDKSVVEGINSFIAERNMDMIVMIPHRHSFLKNIFQEPNTKRMAFHTNIPLMAIHE